MPTNDEINWEINEPIISRYGIQTWKNGKRSPDHLVDVHHTGISLNYMLNEARADAAKKERERILKSGEYVSRSFMKLEIKQARADERQRCVEKLYDIDGETEAESLWFMEHVLERIRKKEDARAKFGGSKELPPRDMIWEGINYYKEQAIAKLSKR